MRSSFYFTVDLFTVDHFTVDLFTVDIFTVDLFTSTPQPIRLSSRGSLQDALASISPSPMLLLLIYLHLPSTHMTICCNRPSSAAFCL